VKESFIAPTNAEHINIKTLNLMYICCALVGAIIDSVSQNARCKSEKKSEGKLVSGDNALSCFSQLRNEKALCKYLPQ